MLISVSFFLVSIVVHFKSFELGRKTGYQERIEDEKILLPDLVTNLKHTWEQDRYDGVDQNSPRIMGTRKAVLDSLVFWNKTRSKEKASNSVQAK